MKIFEYLCLHNLKHVHVFTYQCKYQLSIMNYNLNHDLLDSLYRSLSAERKKKLLKDLFGEGRQSLAYFRRTKDTSLSKVAYMARFFNMPIDALMADTPYVYDPHSHTISEAGQQAPSSSQQTAEIEHLQEKIKFLEEIASLREDKIQLLEEKLNACSKSE